MFNKRICSMMLAMLCLTGCIVRPGQGANEPMMALESMDLYTTGANESNNVIESLWGDLEDENHFGYEYESMPAELMGDGADTYMNSDYVSKKVSMPNDERLNIGGIDAFYFPKAHSVTPKNLVDFRILDLIDEEDGLTVIYAYQTTFMGDSDDPMDGEPMEGHTSMPLLYHEAEDEPETPYTKMVTVIMSYNVDTRDYHVFKAILGTLPKRVESNGDNPQSDQDKVAAFAETSLFANVIRSDTTDAKSYFFYYEGTFYIFEADGTLKRSENIQSFIHDRLQSLLSYKFPKDPFRIALANYELNTSQVIMDGSETIWMTIHLNNKNAPINEKTDLDHIDDDRFSAQISIFRATLNQDSYFVSERQEDGSFSPFHLNSETLNMQLLAMKGKDQTSKSISLRKMGTLLNTFWFVRGTGGNIKFEPDAKYPSDPESVWNYWCEFHKKSYGEYTSHFSAPLPPIKGAELQELLKSELNLTTPIQFYIMNMKASYNGLIFLENGEKVSKIETDTEEYEDEDGEIQTRITRYRAYFPNGTKLEENFVLPFEFSMFPGDGRYVSTMQDMLNDGKNRVRSFNAIDAIKNGSTNYEADGSGIDVTMLKLDGKNWLFQITSEGIYLSPVPSKDVSEKISYASIDFGVRGISSVTVKVGNKDTKVAVGDAGAAYDHNSIDMETEDKFRFTTLANGIVIYNKKTTTSCQLKSFPYYRSWKLGVGEYAAIGFENVAASYSAGDVAYAKFYRFEADYGDMEVKTLKYLLRNYADQRLTFVDTPEVIYQKYGIEKTEPDGKVDQFHTLVVTEYNKFNAVIARVWKIVGKSPSGDKESKAVREKLVRANNTRSLQTLLMDVYYGQYANGARSEDEKEEETLEATDSLESYVDFENLSVDDIEQDYNETYEAPDTTPWDESAWESRMQKAKELESRAQEDRKKLMENAGCKDLIAWNIMLGEMVQDVQNHLNMWYNVTKD